MKKLFFSTFAAFSIASFSTAAFAVDKSYDESCAKRYIRASQSLVEIANDYNHGEIKGIEYASRVAFADSSVLAMRAYCINESPDAQKCVANTKNGYKAIRRKMEVKRVLGKEVERVSVSKLDLARFVGGAVSGFLRSLVRGEENICGLSES